MGSDGEIDGESPSDSPSGRHLASPASHAKAKLLLSVVFCAPRVDRNTKRRSLTSIKLSYGRLPCPDEVRARATLSLRGRRGPRSRAAVPASRPFGVRSLPRPTAIPASSSAGRKREFGVTSVVAAERRQERSVRGPSSPITYAVPSPEAWTPRPFDRPPRGSGSCRVRGRCRVSRRV